MDSTVFCEPGGIREMNDVFAVSISIPIEGKTALAYASPKFNIWR
jgi:hypothetical protein